MVGALRPPNRMDGTARRTNEEAARWVVRLEAGALSEEEQRELDAWLDAAPHHRGALIRARATWADLDRVGALAGGSTPVGANDSSRLYPASEDRVGDPSAPHSARSQRDTVLPLSPLGERVGVRETVSSTRRWLLAASIAGLAILSASWLALSTGRHAYESGIGEVRRVTLADGSSMVLNTATRAIVRFDHAQREVRLERGEALFHVQKDAVRPFIVRTDDLIVRAVGTAFAVRVAEAQVDVTVTEGVVELARSAGNGPETQAIEEPKRVVANQRAVVKTAEPVAIEPIAPEIAERRLAWRAGMVAFDGEPLSDAVAEVNRHTRRQIVVDDEALAARPVVGIFRASDVEGFAQTAATALGAEAVNEGDVIRLKLAEPH